MAVYRFRPVADLLIVALIVVTVSRIAVDRFDFFNTEIVPKLLEPGDRPGLDTHIDLTSQRNLILFALTTCAACKASAPLYERLGRMTAANNQHVRFVVVSTEAESVVRDWLADNSIRPDQVVSVGSFEDIGITITPTLAVASSAGVITDVHIGTLTDDKVDTLLARLRDEQGVPPLNNAPRELSDDDCDRLTAGASVSNIDLREREEYLRGHAPRAINIPLHELPARALFEVPTGHIVLIDSMAPIDRRRVAGIALRNLDYPQVMLCGDLTRRR